MPSGISVKPSILHIDYPDEIVWYRMLVDVRLDFIVSCIGKNFFSFEHMKMPCDEGSVIPFYLLMCSSDPLQGAIYPIHPLRTLNHWQL